MIRFSSRVIFPAALLAGCAPTSHFQDKNYGMEEFRDSQVGFIPMRACEVEIAADEEFGKAFEKQSVNEGEGAMAESFNRGFLTLAKPRFRRLSILDTGTIWSGESFRKTNQVLNKGKRDESDFLFEIPEKSAVDRITPPTRFVIMARNALFEYASTNRVGFVDPSTGATTSSGGGNRIDLTLVYMIWDYRNGAPVSFGTYHGFMSAKYFFTKEEWRGMMADAAAMILFRSPLRLPFSDKSTPAY